MVLHFPVSILRLPAFLRSAGGDRSRDRSVSFRNPMDPSPSPDERREEDELVRRIAGGDQDALADLYDRISGTLLAVAMRVLNDQSAAEDVVQDVFLHIWNKAGTFDPDTGKAIGWSVVITRNKAIDRLRARIRASHAVERAAAEIEAPVDRPSGLGDSDRAAYVNDALSGLDPEQRVAIELAFYSGLSQSEIADRLSKPLGTVKAHIRRGMLKLRDKLQQVL
jgi:RNA polymerase sigma-70 factor (ECF subfamily)